MSVAVMGSVPPVLVALFWLFAYVPSITTATHLVAIVFIQLPFSIQNSKYLVVDANITSRFLKFPRLLVNSIANYLLYRPILVSDDPIFTPNDVTVIIPSVDGDTPELRRTVRSVVQSGAQKAIIVTPHDKQLVAEQMAESISSKMILVLSVKKANKRRQLCKALPFVETPIIVFADDDVSWPGTLLPWMLAPFKDPRMGGVGTNQRLRRERYPNVWNFLGSIYLIRRNFDCTATTYIDGGIPCLSGRTVAYRTHILQDPDFIHSFTHETWQGFGLNADDDNFLTRWMVENDWKTTIQNHSDCEVETTLEDNPKYWKQCQRWSRSNWRSNWTTLFIEKTTWRRHKWSTYAVFLTTLTSWALIADFIMLYTVWLWSANFGKEARYIIRTASFLFIVFLCRLVKYVTHFWKYPADLKFVLLIPLFGYIHSIAIKTWAAYTMRDTSWGSREDADANDDYRLINLPLYDAVSPTTGKAVAHKNDGVESDEEMDQHPLLPKYGEET